MKVIFFGSSIYCLPVLESLYNNFNLIAVITKSNGYIYNYCLKNNIQVFIPADKKELSDLKPSLQKSNPDIAVVSDYGLIIPKEIFEIPKYKTLNIHFSKLPKFRGPSPVQYTILYGEKSAFVTLMVMEQTLDKGEIIWQKEIGLSGDETTDYLYKKLFNIVSLVLKDVINSYIKGKLTPKPQNHSKATYTRQLTREDGFIPFNLLRKSMNNIKISEEEVKQVRLSKIIPVQLCTLHFALCIKRALLAFTPWPGIWTEIELKGKPLIKRLKILKSHLEPIQSHLQGQPLKMASVKLVLDLVQLEGKKPVSWKQLLVGYPQLSSHIRRR